ncbi:MAG: DNA recombination protein RmuC, partial [Vulcanimicrobiaceae bacterium]
LRSYALGWQQRRQEENAKRIAELGRELYERVRIFAGHFNAIGSSLQKAIGAYNSAVGSMESRVLPQGRRLKDAASLTEPELPEAATLDIAPRELAAPDVLPMPDTPAG